MSGSSILTPTDSPADLTSTASASPVTDTPDLNRQEPTIPVDFPSSPEVSQSPLPVEASAQVGQNPQVPQAPDLSVSPLPVPESTEQSSIKDSSTVPEASQVQSGAPEPASRPTDVQPSETKTESAGIAPNPPQASQVAPSADSQPKVEPRQSFGDLISNSQPLPTPHQPSLTPVPSVPQASASPEVVSPLPDLSVPSIPPTSPAPSSTSPVTPDLSEKRKQAIQTRKQKVAERLDKIVAFVRQKGKVSNRDIRDLLHVSQTTVSDYCHILVSSGKLKREGKAKATRYSLL